MSHKFFFLDRQKQFVECELVKSTSHKRHIKFTEGENLGKTQVIHPPGVAWGQLYPRLFQAETKPTDYFMFKGRVLMKTDTTFKNLVPQADNNYRFQPFLVHIIDAVNARENILLTGGTGVGKTTHIEQLAARCNQPTIRVNFNGESRLSDFIGKTHVVSGATGSETRWVDGVLPLAMKQGHWLLLDELDMADPSVLSLLHPVLEENPCLVLKENNGEVVRPHPNFRVFATANSIGAMADRAKNFSGTNEMNDAFLDRWQVMLVPNLSFKEELKVVKAKVSGVKHRWAKRIVEFAHKVRDKKLDGIDFSGDNFSTRRVLAWTKKTALLRSPIEGARLAWLDKIPQSEQEPIVKILELHFGTTSRKKTNSLNFAKPEAKRGRGRPKKV